MLPDQIKGLWIVWIICCLKLMNRLKTPNRQTWWPTLYFHRTKIPNNISAILCVHRLLVRNPENENERWKELILRFSSNSKSHTKFPHKLRTKVKILFSISINFTLHKFYYWIHVLGYKLQHIAQIGRASCRERVWYWV